MDGQRLDVLEAAWFFRFADDKQLQFVCAGHVGANQYANSLLRLFSTRTLFVPEMQRATRLKMIEETSLVYVVDVIFVKRRKL